MPSQQEIRQAITNRIVEALKNGNLPPWRQTWRNDPNCGQPANIVSQKTYRGINPLLLQIASMRHAFKTRWWATFRQWDTLGCRVMRRPDNVPPGEWGTNIIFWKPVTVTEKNDDGKDEEKRIFVLRTYTIFNLDQVVGDHLNRYRAGFTTLTDEEMGHRFKEAEKVIVATNADIRHGGNQAFYSRMGDYIQMPFRHQFKGAGYWETLCHEMVHWTEPPHRLNWDRANEGYAMGELIAEIGGCFLASELGLPVSDQANHAAYIQHWLQAMQNDPAFIFKASTQASKAVDFILAFSRTPVEEEALAE